MATPVLPTRRGRIGLLVLRTLSCKERRRRRHHVISATSNKISTTPAAMAVTDDFRDELDFAVDESPGSGLEGMILDEVD